MQQVDEGVCQRDLLVGKGLEHVSAHGDGVMVEQDDQDVDAGSSEGGSRVFDGECNDGKEAVVDQVCKQVAAGLGLEVLCNAHALVEELDGVFALAGFGGRGLWGEEGEEFAEEGGVGLQVLDDVDLVEEDEGVEDGEGWVVEDAGEDYVFEVLQAPGVAYLAQDDGILDGDYFLVAGAVVEVLAVVCLVSGEVRVVLEGADDGGDDGIGDDLLDDGVVVEQDEGLHDVAEAVEVCEPLEVFGDGDQGQQLDDVLFLDDEAGDGVSTWLGSAGAYDEVLDLCEVCEVWRREHDGAGEAVHGVVGQRVVYAR